MKKSDEIREKIKKKQEQIEKRKKTTEKHVEKRRKLGENLAKAGVDLARTDDYEYRRSFSNETLWDIIDYAGMSDDIKTSKGKQEELERQLENLQLDLEKQLNKEKVPFIPAIEDLLNHWEKETRKYIKWCPEENSRLYKEYKDARDILDGKLKDYPFNTYTNFRYDSKYNRITSSKLEEKYIGEGKYNLPKTLYEEMNNVFHLETIADNFKSGNQLFINMAGDEEKTSRFIRDEKEARRIDLIERVTKVVGEIKDATALSFGNNGCINGIVVGEKGKAFVETIGAGGYNIQRYHYRVLVHRIKEKPSLDAAINTAKTETNRQSSGIKKTIDIER